MSLKDIVRPLTPKPMTRVSLYSHTSTLLSLSLFSLFSLPSHTSYPFTIDTLIFQPKIKIIMTQNFQEMILGVYQLTWVSFGWVRHGHYRSTFFVYPISQPIINILTQNFHNMNLWVYSLHQECHG